MIRLAWRSIWRKRWRTLITVGSIGLGLSVAVFFIALGEGIYAQLIDDVVRMQAGHLTCEHPDYRRAPAVDLYLRDVTGLRSKIDALPRVEQTKLIVLGQGVARTARTAAGVSIMGVEPAVEHRTSLLARRIVAGRYLRAGDRARVVIGAKLAERLRLRVGRKLVLMTNDAKGKLVQRLARVVGVFRTGSVEMDAYFIQAPLGYARRLFGLPADAATQLGVILRRPEDQDRVKVTIARMVRGRRVEVYAWEEILPELASYIRLDWGSNIVFQALLMILILFTIFNTILMSVLDRRREFAVLLAVGTPPSLLRRQVFCETALIGLIGCALGVLVGGLGAWAVQVWGLDLSALTSGELDVSGFAFSSTIRAKVTPGLLLTTAGGVWLITLGLSLIPMRRLGRLSLVDELR
ncbi:MAG: ABC transporter permease [Proteobacteria bacterium]|nr:ABC transporter permease [Pseudomonadota bacterium]MBU1742696.1 ABC transporter permease [Pseudomonadota bacterium]